MAHGHVLSRGAARLQSAARARGARRGRRHRFLRPGDGGPNATALAAAAGERSRDQARLHLRERRQPAARHGPAGFARRGARACASGHSRHSGHWPGGPVSRASHQRLRDGPAAPGERATARPAVGACHPAALLLPAPMEGRSGHGLRQPAADAHAPPHGRARDTAHVAHADQGARRSGRRPRAAMRRCRSRPARVAVPPALADGAGKAKGEQRAGGA